VTSDMWGVCHVRAPCHSMCIAMIQRSTPTRRRVSLYYRAVTHHKCAARRSASTSSANDEREHDMNDTIWTCSHPLRHDLVFSMWPVHRDGSPRGKCWASRGQSRSQAEGSPTGSLCRGCDAEHLGARRCGPGEVREAAVSIRGLLRSSTVGKCAIGSREAARRRV